jgi:DNA repair exonuclease SbcCD nuclease subunit
LSKFVVFSDLHLNEWSYGSTLVDGKNSRLLAQADVLRQIREYCIAEDVRSVFFCGDLFHTHSKVSAAVLHVAYEEFKAFNDADIFVTFLVGNHDMSDRAGQVHTLDFLSLLGQVIKPNEGVIQNGGSKTGPTYYYYSYTEDREALLDFLAFCDQPGYLFLHQGVQNVSMGSGFVIPNEILSADDIPSNIIMAFTGHYHSHRKVSDNLYIVGSPMQHDWGDTGENRGWLLVDGKEVTLIPSKAPWFMELTKKELLADPELLVGNYVRVKGDVGDLVKESILGEGALSVEFVVTKETTNQELIAVDSFELEPLIKEFEKRNKVTKVLGDIGRELRS